MNLLAIDTSTNNLSFCISCNGKVIVDLNRKMRFGSSQLIPLLEKQTKKAKVDLKSIDAFVVGEGPGSFTGLRIGLSTIKGFTIALGKPVIGLPTLDTLASNALSAGGKIICPLIDAKRNLLFAALYEVGLNNRMKRKSPYLLIDIEELLKKLRSYKSIVFLGDGLRLYQKTIEQRVKNSIILNENTWYPKVKNLIKLDIDLINKKRFTPLDKKRRQNKRHYLTGFSDAKRIKPIYLYPKECQIKPQITQVKKNRLHRLTKHSPSSMSSARFSSLCSAPPRGWIMNCGKARTPTAATASFHTRK